MYQEIQNEAELQKECGIYYPYIMQELGCPVINGRLIKQTSLKYLYAHQAEGIYQILSSIHLIPKRDFPVNRDDFDKYPLKFPEIDPEEFEWSFINAVADCFYDGCEPEDYSREDIFGFLYEEKEVSEWKRRA